MPPSHLEWLDEMFGSVAHKIRPIPFQLGAATARYLNNLAYGMPAGMEREQVLRISEVVWGRVFQFAAFRQATKEEALRILAAQGPTFHLPFDFREAIREVKDRPEPVFHLPKPMLTSKHVASTKGTDPVRLENDLTERIYAAYWRLRLDKAKNARRQVADALNRAKVPRVSREGLTDWTTYDIGERLKHYEKSVGSSDRDGYRKFLVEKWRTLIGL